MHPLITNLSTLKNAELELTINDLTKKYFMTHNYEIQQQIIAMLDTYKEELANRQSTEWDRILESRNKGLDKLINIS